MFWWIMFFTNLLYGLTMILGGWSMLKMSSKNVNNLIGYRTKRSTQNQDAWKFANENCGRRWLRLGWIVLLVTVVVQLPYYGKEEDVVANVTLVIAIVACVIMIVSIFPTEKALKEHFDEKGRKIHPDSVD